MSSFPVLCSNGLVFLHFHPQPVTAATALRDRCLLKNIVWLMRLFMTWTPDAVRAEGVRQPGVTHWAHPATTILSPVLGEQSTGIFLPMHLGSQSQYGACGHAGGEGKVQWQVWAWEWNADCSKIQKLCPQRSTYWPCAACPWQPQH